MRRGLNFVVRRLEDVEVCDSEYGQSHQRERARLRFTMTVGTRTEGSNHGPSLESLLTPWRLFAPFPLAFASCWLDMTER